MKRWSKIFTVGALLLSHVMCAVVAGKYVSLVWCGQYGGCSAPPSVAFLYAIPYGIGIALCLAQAAFCHKHSH